MYGTVSGYGTYGTVVALTALAAVGLYYSMSGRGEQVQTDALIIRFELVPEAKM